MNSHAPIAPSARRLLWLLPLAAFAVLSVLGSSTFDEQQTEVEVLVDVSFVLGSLSDDLEWDAGTNVLTLSGVRLAGEYRANGGDKLTLDRDPVTFDTTGGFTLTVADTDPSDDDNLDGVLVVSITQAISLPDNDDPSAGQISIDNAGTTTLVTVTGSGVDIEIGAGAASFFDWEDFADLEADEDANDDQRLARLAWLQVERLLQLALGTERLLEDIDTNADTLEAMNLNEQFALTCDDAGGEALLFWRTDASGTGEGEVSDGDAFEARFGSCFLSESARYQDGTVSLENYVEAKGDSPRQLGIDITFRDLFFGEAPVDLGTIPSLTSPRINGDLSLSYLETVVATEDPT